MAAYDQYRNEDYAPTGAVSSPTYKGRGRGGRAKTYSDARAGISRTGGTVTPGRRFSIPLGGWGGGGQRGSHFAELDFEYQKELDKLVWERSTPDVTGVGGQVRWDRDKNMVTSTLSEENQAIYDAMYERQR